MAVKEVKQYLHCSCLRQEMVNSDYRTVIRYRMITILQFKDG